MTDNLVQSDNILLGLITSAHGLKGQFKVKSFTDPAENIVRYEGLTLPSGKQITIKLVGVSKELLICSAKEITDRTDAEQIQKQELRIARTVRPPASEDEVYQADLVGFTVVDTDANQVGAVLGFHNFGAGDLIEVKSEDTDSVFLPFTGFFEAFDMAKKQIVMQVPDGLIKKHKS